MVAVYLLALVPFVAAQITRGNTFVGCSLSTPGGFGPYADSDSQPSSSACAAFCATASSNPNIEAGISYSFYIVDSSISSTSCLCTTSDFMSPSADYISPSGADGADADVCTMDGIASVYMLGTTFTLDQCYGSINPSGSGISFTSSATLHECFTLCRFSTTAFVLANNQPGRFNCICAPSSSTGSGGTTTCDSTSRYFRYTHSPAAASLGLGRRRKIQVNEGEEYCPAGLTACKVGTSGYECLDVSSELEACGGCIDGEYGGLISAKRGVNCLSLAGDIDTMMTCRRGECIDEVAAQ